MALLADRLHPSDGPALVQFCEALHLRALAFAELQRSGLLAIDERGLPRRSPALTTWKQCDASCRSFFLQFQLTPESRRLAGITPKAPEADEFTLYLQRRGNGTAG